MFELEMGVISVLRKQMFVQAKDREAASKQALAENIEDEIS